MKKTMVLITAILMLASVSKGMEPVTGPMSTIMYESRPRAFDDEGLFVIIPAELGNLPLVALGFCLIHPFVWTSDKITGEYHPKLTSLMSICYSNATFGHLGYFTLGTPFYIVKKVLWDGPVYLYEAVTGEDEEEAGGVNPAKERAE